MASRSEASRERRVTSRSQKWRVATGMNGSNFALRSKQADGYVSYQYSHVELEVQDQNKNKEIYLIESHISSH